MSDPPSRSFDGSAGYRNRFSLAALSVAGMRGKRDGCGRELCWPAATWLGRLNGVHDPFRRSWGRGFLGDELDRDTDGRRGWL